MHVSFPGIVGKTQASRTGDYETTTQHLGEPMTQQTTTISPDGQWMWNGTEWVPNPTAAATGMPAAPQTVERPKKKHLGLKITGGIIGAFVLLGIAGAVGGDGTEAAGQSTESAAAEAPAAEEPAVEEPEAAAQEPAPAPEPVEPEAPAETVAQANAVRSAEDYLSFTAFSRNGLIDQLEFEGYSTADATYAVDSLGVDWNEQAAQSAQDYLDFTSFSRQGLIEQLEFEGFTYEQAVYGVNTTGL
jgi:hypothetical protein